MSSPTMELRHRKSNQPTVGHLGSQQEDDSKKKQLKQFMAQHITRKDYMIAGLTFCVALSLRLKDISMPNQVVFDEVHFGQHASHYINQSFFFDVHPPLAKLLIALVAKIAGYDGQFGFKQIGDKYSFGVPYVAIRAFGSVFGSLVIPLAYLTIRNAGHSIIAATMTALAICFENGLITNNRLILLDSYLLFFTAFSIFCYTSFCRQRAFTSSWWLWLLATGVGLGCACSSKWVGFFTLATVGAATCKQLWDILGDVKVTKRKYFGHLFARFFCLCIVPAAIYIATFYVHFSILTKTGPGAPYMEIETQSELNGIAPVDTPVPIAYGSIVTIRHRETTGGYLHSHLANYPEGSGQQQVTLYPFKDQNNWWKILKANPYENATNDMLGSDGETYLEYVRDGDIIRLEHVVTSPRKLHSHDIPAPVTDTDYHFEISAYGFVDYPGDSNDFWRVQIDENNVHPEAGEHLEARRSLFRLEHPNQNCHLYSTYEKLPEEWGFGQQEVSCINDGLKPKTMWIIDETANPLLPADVPIEHEVRPGFWSKFVRLHQAMWEANNELDDSHPFESRPSAWPLLRSSVTYWLSESAQIVLLGNPLVFWISTLAVLAFGAVYGFLQLRDKRGFHDTLNGHRAFFEGSAGFFVAGWALHYFPFYLMKRQLFLHHYMPALYMAILALGVGFDLVMKRFPRAFNVCLAAVAGACIIYTYYFYSPIVYGKPWNATDCEQGTLMNAWELNCERYLPTGAPQRINLMGRDEEMILARETGSYADYEVPEYIPMEKPSNVEVVETREEVIDDDDENVVYVDGDGNRIDPKKLPADVLAAANELLAEDDDEEEEEGIVMENYDEDDDEDDDDDDDDDEVDAPTDPPVYAEPEPEFIDGKEVYGEDDDEDEYPKTIYGVDPEAEDEEEADPNPLKVRDIPSTTHA